MESRQQLAVLDHGAIERSEKLQDSCGFGGRARSAFELADFSLSQQIRMIAAYRCSMTTTPAGSDGLPLIGETLSFAKNPFRFIEERLSRHGRIFRSTVLGRKTAVIAGPEAAAKFTDADLVMREGSMPPHVQELFGGRSLPSLDGEAHRTRKKIINQAFN